METQRSHPSALTYGLAAILSATVIIGVIEVFDWKLSRLFNTEAPAQMTAALPATLPTLTQTSHTALSP